MQWLQTSSPGSTSVLRARPGVLIFWHKNSSFPPRLRRRPARMRTFRGLLTIERRAAEWLQQKHSCHLLQWLKTSAPSAPLFCRIGRRLICGRKTKLRQQCESPPLYKRMRLPVCNKMATGTNKRTPAPNAHLFTGSRQKNAVMHNLQTASCRPVFFAYGNHSHKKFFSSQRRKWTVAQPKIEKCRFLKPTLQDF